MASATGPLATRASAAARWWTAAMVVVVAAHLVTRLTGLGRSLWWDEAFTATRYLAQGPSTLLDPDAYVANNHVLFTALTMVTSRVLGSTEEVVLRLWAVGPALVATAVLVAFLWRRLGPAVAVLGATLLTVSPLAVRLATEARGYGLVLLASSVIVVVVVAQAERPTWWGDLAVAASGLAGMLTFPPVVAIYLAHTGVWFVTRTAHRVRLVVLTGAAGATTVAVLSPLLPAMLDRAGDVGTNFSDPIGWTSPVVAPLRILGGPSLEAVTLGRVGVAAAVAAVLGVLGLVVAWYRDRVLLAHLVASLGGAIALLGLVGFHLADRYLSTMLPQVVIAVAVGLAAIVGAFGHARPSGAEVAKPSSAAPPSAAERPARPPWAAIVVAALVLAIGTPAALRAVTLPVQEFAGASAAMVARDPTAIVVRQMHSGYRWYLEDLAGAPVVRTGSAQELDEAFCTATPPVVYAPHPDTEPAGAPPSCLDDAERFELPQSRDPGFIHWYVRD